VLRPTLVLQALTVLFIGGYLSYLASRRRLPGPTALDWPIAALFLAYVAAIATSIYPRVSLEASLPLIVALLTFYAFHDFDFLRAGVMVRGLTTVGAIAAAYALMKVGEDYADWLRLMDAVDGGIGAGMLLPPAVPRVEGVGDNVNILAMALNLTLPFALVLALRPERRLERVAGVLAALLMLAALFFTLSRGAWLGTAAALSAFAVLYLSRDLESGPVATVRQKVPARVIIGGVVALLLVVAAGAAGLSRWDSRPEWLFRPSLSPRFDALEVGIEIVRDRPLLGSGPFTYPLLYNIYSGEYPAQNIHPHNGYVNILVDVGILGALACLAGGIILATRIIRSYVEAPIGERVIVAACVASLISLGVHSLADSPNVWTTALLPFAAVLAMSLRLSPRPDRTAGLDPALAPRLLIALLPFVLFALWLRFDIPHVDFDRSVQALQEGDFEQSTKDAGAAGEGDPASAAYRMNEGVNAAILYLVSRDERRQRPELLEGAAEALRSAIDAEPRGALADLNLALVYQLMDDKFRAVDAARRAITRAPLDGTVTLVAGTVLEWADRPDEAAAAYATALSKEPSLLQSPFWGLSGNRFALRQGAVDASELTACEVGRIAALYAGYDDNLERLALECRDRLRTRPGDARARSDLAVMLTALGRDGEALEEARRAADAVPDNPFVRAALGIALLGAGDLQDVRHELAVAAHLKDPDAAMLLAATYGPPLRETPVLRRVKQLAQPDDVPAPVVDLLEKALRNSAPMVFDDGIQRYALGILYYRVRFMRESPTSILVPGSWIAFASPRSLLIQEMLEKQ
jgi:O-antigen ligase